MNKFTIMAEDAIKSFDGTDIDKHLSKIASDNNLNAEEHQRLVEEYNVGKFLKKLADGSHHEEYDVASPVVVPKVSSGTSDTDIKKTASIKSNYSITSDMFFLDTEEEILDTGDLRKVASANVDDYIMNSEEKWVDAELKRMEVMDELSGGLEKLSREEELYSKVATLTKLASETEGTMKTVVATLSMAGKNDIAEHMLENSKFSTFDLMKTSADTVSDDIKGLMSEIVNWN